VAHFSSLYTSNFYGATSFAHRAALLCENLSRRCVLQVTTGGGIRGNSALVDCLSSADMDVARYAFGRWLDSPELMPVRTDSNMVVNRCGNAALVAQCFVLHYMLLRCHNACQPLQRAGLTGCLPFHSSCCDDAAVCRMTLIWDTSTQSTRSAACCQRMTSTAKRVLRWHMFTWRQQLRSLPMFSGSSARSHAQARCRSCGGRHRSGCTCITQRSPFLRAW
jgi:hypothetical protein